MPARYYPVPFAIDHIIARQHRGKTVRGNLALACLHCNSYKGPNIASLDPRTGKLTRLFNPRRHAWHRHFRWHGAHLIGLTPIGRATVAVLNMNAAFMVRLREELIEENLFPPSSG